MDIKIKYWIDISDEDLETAEILLDKNKYLYSGYLLQQSIEKVLKALYQKIFNEFPPKTHNLIYLAEKIGVIKELSIEQENLLYKLNTLNIETRYPEYREKIMNSLNKNILLELLKETQELQKWIKKKL